MSSVISIIDDKNEYTNKLKSLKENIEGLTQYHQSEILRIFCNNKVDINENKNGVFINLSLVDESIIKELENYLSYVNTQESQLNELEKEKQKIVKSFFKV